MRTVLLAFFLVGSLCGQVLAQPGKDMLNQMNERTRIYRFLNELTNAMETKQLEMTADQEESVRALLEDRNRLSRESQLKDNEYLKEHGPDRYYREEFVATENRKMNEALAALERKTRDEILLPHQVAILNQFVFRAEVKNAGGNLLAMIVANPNSNPLGLSKEQQATFGDLGKSMKEKGAQLQRKFEEDVEALKKEYEQLGRAELTEEQNRKLDTLLGTGPITGPINKGK